MVMDIFEFQLRYQAYQGLCRICKLDRGQETFLQLSKISDQGVLEKKLQDVSPDELKEITKRTYTPDKLLLVETHQDFWDDFTKELFFYPLGTYIERLEYELKVIKEMGFHTYMLVVSDFVMRAKRNSIMVGPGRGSGAGSLLAYCVWITDVNPFAYDLLFERFLNPARISMPDFDIDFEDTLRDKVVDYVTEKYGVDKVCAIGTYMKLATKAAFKDAARAIGIPFERSNQVSNLLGDIISLKDIALVTNREINEELRSLYQQDNHVKRAIDEWGDLEWNLRQLWVHACGVIISPDPVIDHTPTQVIMKNREETLVSQYDGPTLEYIWLLKMDFLGLRNLSVIKNCIKILKAKYTSISKEQLPDQYVRDYQLFDEFLTTMSFQPRLDDALVYEKVFIAWDTTGIFQFEWEGIRKFLVELQPNHINDLVAMGALYRPGPLEFIPTYIKRKHGEEQVEYMLPELIQILQQMYHSDDVVRWEQYKLEEDLWPIMWLTYGIAVYQEQLMFLVQSMAWFSLPEADLLRRWIGKKKKEVIEQLKKEFVARAESYKWYKPETAKFIYEKMIEPAASYSFNKSHAVCYAHIAYQTWYLKAHYPIEFYAALIRSVEDDTDKLAWFIEEARQQNIPVYQPDINRSYNHMAAIEDGIIMGFFACKGLWFEIGEYIEQERKRWWTYASLQDFLTRCFSVINRKSLESLIKSGTLDQWYDRNTLLANLEILLEWNASTQIMEMGLFWGVTSIAELVLSHRAQTTIIDRCRYDMDIFKTTISWHPFDGLYLYMKRYGFISQHKDSIEPWVFNVMWIVKKITRAKKKWFFILIEDVTDSLEFFIKELLDIKIYDVFIISGYKSRSRSPDTLIKVSLESIVDQAKKMWKYDSYWTVDRVRIERKKDKKDKKETSLLSTSSPMTSVDISFWDQDEIGDPFEDDITINTNTWDDILDDISQEWESLDNGDAVLSTGREKISFSLPDSLSKINTMLFILQNYQGTDHKATIWWKEYSVSSIGLQKLQELWNYKTFL